MGGSVTILGTATVSISGTPSVSISGTPTVILGGGSASIGSISAIGSTVTVAGTINIGNTPAVTISGTPAVTISSGTVSISGSVVVNVNNTTLVVSSNQHTTLTTALTNGVAVAALAVAALAFPLVPGQRLTLVSGANTQNVSLVNAAPAGAVSLVVVSFTPNFSYPIGASVIFGTAIHANIGSTAINPATTLTAGSATGQAIFTPADLSIFYVGGLVVFVSVTGGTGYTGFVKSVNNNGTVTLTVNFAVAFNANDAVLVVGAVGVFASPIAANVRPRSWDGAGSNAPGAGLKATFTLAAVVGSRYVITMATGFIFAGAAIEADTFDLNLGALQAFAALNAWPLSVKTGWDVLSHNGALGAAATVRFAAAPAAGNQQAVNIGAYLVPGAGEAI